MEAMAKKGNTMTIDFETVLKDMDGHPIRDAVTITVPFTLKRAIMNSLSTNIPNDPADEAEKELRWTAMQKIISGGELTADELKYIKGRVYASYNAVVAGQVLALLEGKQVHTMETKDA